MPVIFREDKANGVSKNTVIQGDILLPISEITVISRTELNHFEGVNNHDIEECENDAFADALASIEDEVKEDVPYRQADIIKIKTECKIRSSENTSLGLVSLKDREKFKLVETGQMLVRLDGTATIEIIAIVYDTPNEYIKPGDTLIQVTPLQIQVQ